MGVVATVATVAVAGAVVYGVNHVKVGDLPIPISRYFNPVRPGLPPAIGRPKSGLPTGTRPIDGSGLGKEQIHDVKDGIGAGPRDWVGISPDGDVWTGDSNGNPVNHGPWKDYTHP